MDAPPSLVPDGVSRSIDLTQLTADQRRSHHIQQLRRIAYQTGAEGIAAYKLAHPDAAPIRVNVNALAYSPKPQGYDAAILDRVTQWLASDVALAATNRDDVDRLNTALGTARFNSANHFSKALSPSLLARVASICASHGTVIQPRPGMTMGQVRQSIRAARSSGAAAAQPFGNVGTRSGNALTIGGRIFTVGKHSDRECISVTTDGVTQRVSLASVAAICAGLLDSTGAGSISHYPLRSRTGEPCPDAVAAERDTAPPNWRTLPANPSPAASPIYERTLPADDPIDPEPLSDAEKMDRLTAAVAVRAAAWDTPAQWEGLDPLQL